MRSTVAGAAFEARGTGAVSALARAGSDATVSDTAVWRTGSVNVKVLPDPGSLSTQSLPP